MGKTGAKKNAKAKAVIPTGCRLQNKNGVDQNKKKHRQTARKKRNKKSRLTGRNFDQINPASVKRNKNLRLRGLNSGQNHVETQMTLTRTFFPLGRSNAIRKPVVKFSLSKREKRKRAKGRQKVTKVTTNVSKSTKMKILSEPKLDNSSNRSFICSKWQKFQKKIDVILANNKRLPDLLENSHSGAASRGFEDNSVMEYSPQGFSEATESNLHTFQDHKTDPSVWSFLQQYMQSKTETTPKPSSDNNDLIEVLRQVSAFGNYLDSLAPRVLDLLSAALKSDHYSNGYGIEVLSDGNNCVVLKLVKEKFMALLERRIIDEKFIGIVENLVSKITLLLSARYSRMRQQPTFQESFSNFSLNFGQQSYYTNQSCFHNISFTRDSTLSWSSINFTQTSSYCNPSLYQFNTFFSRE